MFDRKAYRKQYYQQHRQLEIDRARKWCLDHPEERKAWKRAAWAKNKYVNRAIQRKYKKQKKLTDYYKHYWSTPEPVSNPYCFDSA